MELFFVLASQKTDREPSLSFFFITTLERKTTYLYQSFWIVIGSTLVINKLTPKVKCNYFCFPTNESRVNYMNIFLNEHVFFYTSMFITISIC